MYIVSTQQMQAAEKAADASGLSYDQMMENAGRAVAKAIEITYDVSGASVLILVGPGNNGGDGLVVARYLARRGVAVTVYVWKRNTEDDKNWALLDGTGVKRVFKEDDDDWSVLSQLLQESAIVVDALLGTGVSRPIEGSLADLLERAKNTVDARRTPQDGKLVTPARPAPDPEFGPAVVALDVPSGLNSDTGHVDPYTLPADLTVTLAAVKQGHVLMPGPSVVGHLMVGDIEIRGEHYPDGITVEMATAAKVARMLPARPATAHKGTFGTAILVAGSINYSGAAVLAGQAATRAGTGLVTMAPPERIYSVVAGRLAEATYLPLADNEGFIASQAVETIMENLDRASALLVGPGLSNNDTTAAFLTKLLDERDSLPPLVADADALNILATQPEWWGLLPPETILTPHPGEMARLMNSSPKEIQANRLEVAASAASKWGHVVLLKGAYTVVATPQGRSMVLPFANPALAKAGSGDVLAGAIVGLRAQGLAAFEAAIGGAYLHGLAGELAKERIGAAAVVAGDLASMLPAAFRELGGGE